MENQIDVLPSKRMSRLKGWGILALSVLGVSLFLFVIGPLGLETRTLKPMADFIDDYSIEANAYYYTEVEEFFDAERHMREHLALVPGGARNKIQLPEDQLEKLVKN